MKSILLLVGFTLFCESVSAGRIRDIKATAKKMELIYLKLGQSTVLRFSEPPRKVVVGNQNYFNIEFIGNDITIQPQGKVKTNLFVYSEKHTYGFILNARNSYAYDDLVNVKWKIKEEKEQVIKLAKNALNLKIMYKNEVSCHLKSIIELRPNFYALDFTLKNLGRSELGVEDVALFLSRSKVQLSKQRLIFYGPIAMPGYGVRGRIFVSLEKKQGFSFHLKKGNKMKKIIISRKYL